MTRIVLMELIRFQNRPESGVETPPSQPQEQGGVSTPLSGDRFESYEG